MIHELWFVGENEETALRRQPFHDVESARSYAEGDEQVFCAEVAVICGSVRKVSGR